MIFHRTKIRVPLITVFSILCILIIEPTLYLLLFFLAAFLHEIGHIIVMAVFSVRIREIVFLPFGIDIIREKGLLSYKKEIAVSLAGGLFNLIIFAAFVSFGETLCFFAWCNFIYAVFNLMPVTGLDGGAALYSALAFSIGEESAGTVMRRVSFIFCILVWMVGIYILLVLNGNFSVFTISLFLFFSAVLKK